MTARGRIARGFVVVAKALALLVTLLLALVAALLLALQTHWGRELVCSPLFDAVSRAIPGSIAVEQCASLSPRLIRLDGVTIRDPSGRPIASGESLEAVPNWGALLTGTIGIKEVSGRAPQLRLVDYGDELAIVSAFVAPTEEPEEDGAPGPDVVIGLIEVEQGRLTDLPDGLSVQAIEGRTNLKIREAVTLDVQSLEAEIRSDQRTTMRLLEASGPLRFGDTIRLDIRAKLEAEGEDAELAASFDGTGKSFELRAIAQTLGGRIDLDAHRDRDRLETTLKVRDLNLRKLPVATRGVARADIDAVAVFSEPIPSMDALERVEADVDIGLRSLALPEMQAEELTVKGRIEGRLPTPNARLVINAKGVRVRENKVESLRLTLEGQDGRYDVAGRAPLPNGWIVGVDLEGQVALPLIRLNGKVSLANTPWSPLVAKLSQLVIEPDEGISVDAFSLTGHGVDLGARGRYAFHGESDVRFDVRSLDLATVSREIDEGTQLTGTLRGEGRVRGTPETPALDASFALDDGSVERVPIQSFRAAIQYSALQSANAKLELDLGKDGDLSLRADARLGRARSLSEAFQHADYDVRLLIDSLAMTALSRVIDAIPPMKGTVSSEVTAKGALSSPSVVVNAHGRELSGDSFARANIDLLATLEDDALEARVDATSDRGAALQATAKAQVDVQELAAGRGAGSTLARPWELRVRVPEQPWSSLPIDIELSTPARVRFELDAKGGDGPMLADVDVDLKMPEVTSTSGGQSPVCPAAEPARLRARARLRNEQTKLEMEAYVAREQILRAEAEAQTQVVAWIRDGLPPRWPAAQTNLTLDQVDLGTVPIVCRHAKGELRAQLDASELFQSAQDVSVRIDARTLAFAGSMPVDVDLQGKATASSAKVEATINNQGRKLAHLFARVPLDIETPGAPLALGAGKISASADFDETPLAVLLAPVPIVARPSGSLNGRLSVSGEADDLNTLRLRGAVQLAQASMTLKDPFLRLDDVDADLQIEPDRLVVRSLSVRDRDGRIDVQGSVGLSGAEPTELDLALVAKQYPLRRAGVMLATFSGQATFAGDLRADPRVIDLKLGREVSLVLPEDLRYGGVQDLAQDPMVIYQGQPGFDRTLSVEQALEAHRRGDPEEKPSTPLIVHVTSTRPFWVRRTDFSFQLGIDVEIHSQKRGTWLEGKVDVRRGFLAILGKNFDVQSGTIQFTGATPVDPTVDLSAKYRLRSGYTVTIDVEGRVSDPELTFSSDAPDANTNAEVIALLLGTSRQGAGDDDADSQTRSVLAGLTAGLVGSLARRELGQYAPIIEVESGGTLDTSGVRAGFALGDLIPESWQHVLLGVYIEGLLAGSEQGPRGGFLLELLFPHHTSTTTTYEQPDNWSLDFLWQP